jgi:hypothetical protein
MQHQVNIIPDPAGFADWTARQAVLLPLKDRMKNRKTALITAIISFPVNRVRSHHLFRAFPNYSGFFTIRKAD